MTKFRFGLSEYKNLFHFLKFIVNKCLICEKDFVSLGVRLTKPLHMKKHPNKIQVKKSSADVYKTMQERMDARMNISSNDAGVLRKGEHPRKTDAELAFKSAVDTIREVLASGRPVTLKGVGTFMLWKTPVFKKKTGTVGGNLTVKFRLTPEMKVLLRMVDLDSLTEKEVE